jgi:hypothetical protein
MDLIYTDTYLLTILEEYISEQFPGFISLYCFHSNYLRLLVFL